MRRRKVDFTVQGMDVIALKFDKKIVVLMTAPHFLSPKKTVGVPNGHVHIHPGRARAPSEARKEKAKCD